MEHIGIRKGKFRAVMVGIILILLCSACKREGRTYIERTGFVFDTVVHFQIYDTKDETLLDEVMNLCKDMESTFSAHDENSELYKLNHRTRGEQRFPISEDLRIAIELANEVSRATDGVFDITIEPVMSLWDFQAEKPAIPEEDELAAQLTKVDYTRFTVSGNEIIFENDDTRIDLGAVAKGYIADRIKDHLIKRGVRSAIINLGGNVLCIGSKPGEGDYKVGIRFPFGAQNEVLGHVRLQDASVVSSGVYERHFELDGVNYHHILDTNTGYPIQNGLTQVTIVSESSMLADALSTACFSLGTEKGLELIRQFPKTYGYFVHENGEIIYSDGAKDLFYENE